MVIGSKGSKIIICTDGVSNVGIGNLDSTPPQEIATFFKNVIQRGKDSGTSISVLSFDECKMEKLGPVAEETGGIVDFIKPTQLGSRLKDELSRATIATNALIKFVVHKSMYIQVLDEAMKECSWDYFIGNIQMDKKVPFCFAPRSEDTDSAQTSGQQIQLYNFPVYPMGLLPDRLPNMSDPCYFCFFPKLFVSL
uniref:VWFA domain-containing protein n=1 Tax=Biomphalaria glabrata TaxID=6526 RepID=A0A2C9L2B4_BIOGL